MACASLGEKQAHGNHTRLLPQPFRVVAGRDEEQDAAGWHAKPSVAAVRGIIGFRALVPSRKPRTISNKPVP